MLSEMITIPDNEYEQVIAQRYLFDQFVNESSGWSLLTGISNVYQVTSFPQYYSNANESFWLLIEKMNSRTIEMCSMSLFDNKSSLVLSNIDIGSLIVVSHNESTSMNYTFALISLKGIQLILCEQINGSSCKLIKKIPFPSNLSNVLKINDGLFVDEIGREGWLVIGTDTGLHGLDLSTLTIVPFMNGINESVSSLSLSKKHQTVFVGTEIKLWINSYWINEWRFEHINGLIDAPITSLVYNDQQDQLWIGQQTGVTLLSPTRMSTGQIHWYFSRLGGQISNPGSDIGHLPFGNITRLSVSHSLSLDNRVWLGSVYGVMRFDPNDTELNSWRVFNSGRYIPNRNSLVNVSSLTVLSRGLNSSIGLGSAAIAVTNQGLSIIRFEMWALSKKAKHYQDLFNQSGRHVKYDLVSDCKMTS